MGRLEGSFLQILKQPCSLPRAVAAMCSWQRACFRDAMARSCAVPLLRACRSAPQVPSGGHSPPRTCMTNRAGLCAELLPAVRIPQFPSPKFSFFSSCFPSTPGFSPMKELHTQSTMLQNAPRLGLLPWGQIWILLLPSPNQISNLRCLLLALSNTSSLSINSYFNKLCQWKDFFGLPYSGDGFWTGGQLRGWVPYFHNCKYECDFNFTRTALQLMAQQC